MYLLNPGIMSLLFVETVGWCRCRVFAARAAWPFAL
jgi:hypothetical protein